VNPYLSVVNQRLHFGRLLLQQLPPAGDAPSKRMLELALCQSVLYQLESAYRFYLREIASTYRCRTPEQIGNVEGLVADLQAMGKHPAEASELANLESTSGTWLNQLLAAYRQVRTVQQEQTSQQSPIAVVQMSADMEPVELDVEGLKTWLAAFVELVERHRQHMQEC
jgi:hypothetical protein